MSVKGDKAFTAFITPNAASPKAAIGYGARMTAKFAPDIAALLRKKTGYFHPPSSFASFAPLRPLREVFLIKPPGNDPEFPALYWQNAKACLLQMAQELHRGRPCVPKAAPGVCLRRIR